MPLSTRMIGLVAGLLAVALCAPGALWGQPPDAGMGRLGERAGAASGGVEHVGRAGPELEPRPWAPPETWVEREPAAPKGGASGVESPSPAGPSPGDPLPLAPPGRSRERGNEGSAGSPGIGLSSLVTVGSSLAVVLGLFFIVAWVMRRATPGNCPLLPNEAFEVLGRAPLAARQQVHLVRLGGKLVLVCISPSGVEALSEVTDPDEVTRLAGLCQRARPDSATAAFRQVFQRFTREHPADRPLDAGRGGPYSPAQGVSSSTGGGLEGTDA